MLADLATLELHRLTRQRVRRGLGAIAKVFAKHDLLTYSSAIAFQVLYAVVPLALLFLAGLGVFGAQSVWTHHIAPVLHRHLSHDAFAIADRTARRVMNAKRGFWLTGGLLVALWGAGAALRSLMQPLNAVYETREDRSWRRRMVTSIGAGALVAAALLGALVVVLGGKLLHAAGVLAVLLFAGRWFAAVVLLLLANAMLIRFVPAKKRPLEWVSVGSGLCTVCWIVATIGFGAYVSAVSYSSFYGALAGVVLLLMYLHVAAIAFLLGVVVDSLLRDQVRARKRR